MKVLNEKEIPITNYSRNQTVEMLRKSGKLAYIGSEGISFDEYAWAYQEAKALGMSDKAILQLFVCCDSSDEIQQSVYNKYGQSRKYSAMYPNDDTLRYNQPKGVKKK